MFWIVPTVNSAGEVQKARLTDELLLNEIAVDRWEWSNTSVCFNRNIQRHDRHVAADDVSQQMGLCSFGISPAFAAISVDYCQQ